MSQTCGEQLVADLAAGDRCDPDDLAGLVVEAVDPDQQQVGEIAGHGAAGVVQRPDELLDEERVAVGAGDDVGEVELAQRLGVQEAHQAAYVGVGERLELQPANTGQAGPLADLPAQRVPAVEVVGAVGHDEGDPAGEGAGEEEAEDVAGGLVGPVGVLDHDEEGGGLGGGLEQRVHRLEELAAGQGGVVASGVAAHPAARLEAAEGGVQLEGGGDHVGGVDGQPAEDLGEREVGKRAVGEVEAVARGDLPAVLEREVAELGEQAGLAEAGVTAESPRR